MERGDSATPEVATRYWQLFVNRTAHTVQSEKPGDNGKHYYYRPKAGGGLSLETIRQHLAGQITIAPRLRGSCGAGFREFSPIAKRLLCKGESILALSLLAKETFGSYYHITYYRISSIFIPLVAVSLIEAGAKEVAPPTELTGSVQMELSARVEFQPAAFAAQDRTTETVSVYTCH